MPLVSATHKQPSTMKAKTVELQHCARMDASSEWVLEVSCRSGKEKWKNLLEVCPGAEIVEKNNRITVTLPLLEEEQEIAAFGKPGEKDVKRMQMAILGRKPVAGRKWIVSVYLCDDTVMAFENLFKKEEKNGKTLLAPRSGLFIVNTVDDIRIELNALEPGWEMNESNVKIIKSTDAWNPPENATDFPSCCFEICHVDETKESFSCTITASHGTETSKQTIMAVFKQIERQKIDEMRWPEKVTYTLPSCDTSDMKTIAKSRSRSLAGETLLETEELNVKLATWLFEETQRNLIKGCLDNYPFNLRMWRSLAENLSLSPMDLVQIFVTKEGCLDNHASKYWSGLAENLSLSPTENVPEYHDGLSPTLDLLECLSNTQPITVETLLRCLETSKKDLVQIFLTKEDVCPNGTGFGFVNAGLEDKPPNFGNRIKVRCCEGEGSSMDKPPNLVSRIKCRRCNGG